MSDTISLTINGRAVAVPRGTSVAAALLMTGNFAVRRSVTGQPRGPLCGMGICFECRATIDGVPHVRTCLVVCQTLMTVLTDAG